MVCLNENISFNIKSLKKNLTLELQHFIEGYEHLIKDDQVNFLKEQLEKKVKSLFNFDYFIYINMNPNNCVFKHQRGKQEGYFCCKNIRKNKVDGSFKCSNHNKNNKPVKRIKKQKKNINKDENKIGPDISGLKINKDGKISNPEIYDKKINNDLIIKENKLNDKSFSDEIKKNKNKINIYKDFILNDDGIYKTLIKDFPLLDFCINKIKKVKYKYKKNHIFEFYNDIKIC